MSYPSIRANTDGVKTLPTPCSTVLEHQDSIKVDEPIRRSGITLNPAFPSFLVRETLLPLLLRWGHHGLWSGFFNILMISRRPWSLRGRA